MTINAGFFWHVHHKILLEWCYDYAEREGYIRNSKSYHEKEIRLRLFKPVKGVLPQEVVETRQALNQARQDCDQAQQDFNQAYDQDKTIQTINQTWQAYNQAQYALDEARQAYGQAFKKNSSAINALHVVECPNCPWNGRTIFS